MAEAEKCWHYAVGSREVGPLSWEELRSLARAGGIVRQTLLWKQGLDHWLAAGRVAGLFDDVPMPVRMVAYAGREPIDEELLRRPRQIAVAMFVALIFELVAAGELILEKVAPLKQYSLPRALLLVANIGAGIAIPMGLFAAIYLPLRWRIFRQVGANYRLLAMIGGAGLVLLLAAWAVWYAVNR